MIPSKAEPITAKVETVTLTIKVNDTNDYLFDIHFSDDASCILEYIGEEDKPITLVELSEICKLIFKNYDVNVIKFDRISEIIGVIITRSNMLEDFFNQMVLQCSGN